MYVSCVTESYLRLLTYLIELGLLGQRVVAEVDCLGGGFGGVPTPGLAPEPRLVERVDRHHVLRIVGQVLVEVGERVGVLRERVVEDPILVAVGAPAELVQVDDKERRDVVRLAWVRVRLSGER